MSKWDEPITGYDRYCAGYMFSPDLSNVVMVRKNRPAWQKGMLNGVGGRLEADETPLHGMVREFGEETGIHWGNWYALARLDCPGATIWFFWAVSARYDEVQTLTDEKIEIHSVLALQQSFDLVHNSNWLIPMALSFNRGETAKCFIVEEVY